MPSEKSKPAKAAVVDFTNVSDEGRRFNKVHQSPGDYRAQVLKVEDAPTKQNNEPQWLFTIQAGRGTYPYYCKLQENQYWKIRNLLVAAGLNVPKKRVKVDPNKIVGKSIGVTLEDEEYNGKMQSVIAATFPTSELEGEDPDENDEDEEEEETEEEDTEEEEEEEEAEEEEDEEEDEDEEPEPPKKSKKAKPEKAKGKKKAKASDDDDELEELEIEDL